MASSGPTDSIDDQAAAWAVEAAHGDMTPEGRADLQEWLAADRRHRGAYMRARAWLIAAEEAVLATQGEDQHAQPARPASDNDNDGDVRERAAAEPQDRPLRRATSQWLKRTAAGGAAIAASLAVLMAAGIPLPLFGPAAPTEDAIQIVQLRDGSVARLSPDARIQVVLSDGIRNITLLSGKATFDVAKDKTRPFVVRSGDVYAQATGTVYSVSRIGRTGGTVKVLEGSVLVWPRDERDQAVRLQAGGTVTLDPGPTPIPTASQNPASPAAQPTRRLSTPDMAQISLDNVPIAQAAMRFNRVNSTKIIIGDAAIGDVRVIGHYKANDPEHFAQAAAIVSGGYVEHDNGNIVIKMK
ncbi:FecR family protein [Croceibacterium xixiisoli]|uniref:FecR family protein n=1 Tax=Croceibacterium xixiisoli TaxID=1476466 RepID=UPI00136F75FD|nr:FecR domain-containing protein [Croceibacterium xixiisoli]